MLLILYNSSLIRVLNKTCYTREGRRVDLLSEKGYIYIQTSLLGFHFGKMVLSCGHGSIIAYKKQPKGYPGTVPSDHMSFYSVKFHLGILLDVCT